MLGGISEYLVPWLRRRLRPGANSRSEGDEAEAARDIVGPKETKQVGPGTMMHELTNGWRCMNDHWLLRYRVALVALTLTKFYNS